MGIHRSSSFSLAMRYSPPMSFSATSTTALALFPTLVQNSPILSPSLLISTLPWNSLHHFWQFLPFVISLRLQLRKQADPPIATVNPLTHSYLYHPSYHPVSCKAVTFSLSFSIYFQHEAFRSRVLKSPFSVNMAPPSCHSYWNP